MNKLNDSVRKSKGNTNEILTLISSKFYTWFKSVGVKNVDHERPLGKRTSSDYCKCFLRLTSSTEILFSLQAVHECSQETNFDSFSQIQWHILQQHTWYFHSQWPISDLVFFFFYNLKCSSGLWSVTFSSGPSMLCHQRCALSVQFLFALLDGTSLCLHSEEQTDCGMLACSTDFEYASCIAECLQRNYASTQPQVRVGIEAFPTLAFLQPNPLLIGQSVRGLWESESSTS